MMTSGEKKVKSKVKIESKADFLDAASKKFGKNGSWKNLDMIEFAEDLVGKDARRYWAWLFDKKFRTGRGEYALPTSVPDHRTEPREPRPVAGVAIGPVSRPMPAPVEAVPAMSAGPVVQFNPNAVSEYSYAVVPARDKFYVPFGEFKKIETIVRSGTFFPVFISGHSGNGKTFMVEQAASRAKRPMIRVQMSRETDEDDLIGGFRLINGETKFMKGPVLRAMELGALLLIDEADRADPGKVMCLQGILEGKPYFVKKTGEVVPAAHGFNVIVTANTKGKGSVDGRYVAAGVLDEAWLERFPITIEQAYPNTGVEKRIVTGYLGETVANTDEDLKFAEYLVTWAEIIRKTFDAGGSEEIISTRRLVHIAQTYRMFGNRMEAIKLCINRFDDDTKSSFLQTYKQVDPSSNDPVPEAAVVAAPVSGVQNPF